jgi:acetyltransferase-like isoleucine patch superfamily enzyme
MKSPYIYGVNVIKKCFWKLRYHKRLTMGWIQSFEKLRIVIKKNGTINIGKFNQNREGLYLEACSGSLIIGNHCFFNINCSITCMEKIFIGDNCKFGNNLIVVDHDHNFKTGTPEFITSPITIGKNVWIGANVVILRGTVIGDNSIIAAGSVIKGEVPNNTIVIKNHCIQKERAI